jgi:hypothetical protein
MAKQVPQPLHDREAKAKAKAAFPRCVVDLMVFLENRVKFRLGDADAGVPDLDA